ncbi:MAG: glycosyltransferase, partial [Candidatus Rokuibacteriota bacterium]
EILAVDDASTDTSAAVATALGARVLRLARNSGPAAARNHGAAQARGDVLLFVDADIVVRPGAVSRVRHTFDEEPGLAALFGSYDAHPRAPGLVSRYRNLLHHFTHQQANRDAVTFWAGLGAVRRAVFLEVGGFDAKRFPSASIEDIELGHRLRRAGHRIRLDPELQGTHLKRWTLWSMVRTDITGRALPWARLILESGAVPADLNLRAGQRVSALLVAVAVPAAALAAARPEFALLSVMSLLGAIGLNRRFYALLRRRGGLPLAIGSVPLHLLYFLYSGASYLYVWGEWRLHGAATALRRLARTVRT